MNIVVTNDDGLYTQGIWTLAEALCAVGNVTVVAPDREQSGVGLGITLRHPVKVYEAVSRIEGVKALAVEGSPADSILLAVQGLTPQPVDLVVSGINEGANLGMNVLVSGTAGAAFQAHFFDIPAIAVSVAGEKPPWEFEPGARVAQALASRFRDGLLNGPLLLNINVPRGKAEEIQGVAITRLARGRYVDTLEKLDTDRHLYYWLARGKSEYKADEGTDVWAVRNKRVSITPLHIDLTSEEAAPSLASCTGDLLRALKG